ncbi:glutathione S-transferase family protein [Croceicoccus marinus]|uniref:Glutathione S-transferase family protein n=2 Tax=Croceicoccus marinus TaxID=450378 RepID=A0A7G6W018_9SPHN|nr:glutathione S-transferase family protein [Croceicoccus marinus]QNE07333.1 glutathione S-transferase family protein [Croceicoccus marinus]
MNPTLYFAPQTCARVSLTALEEIGKPFDTRLIAFLAAEHRAPDFLAINPSGKVPALVTEGGILVQNGAILHYLALTRPEAKLLPRVDDPLRQAQVLSWLFRCSSDLHPLVSRYVLPQFATANPDDADGIRAKGAELLQAQLQPIDDLLRGREWVLDEGWSIIDAYLSWIWFRISGAGFGGFGFGQACLPAIAAHHARASERPSAIAALRHEARAQAELKERGLVFRPPTYDRNHGDESDR